MQLLSQVSCPVCPAAPAAFPGFAVPGQSLGWEACCEILGAVDLVHVAVLIHLFRHRGAAHRVRPSLDGIAVGVLLSMSQPASWAEAHAAPSPGKISVT